MRKQTTFHEYMDDGVEVELYFEPVEHIDMLKAKIGDQYVVAYCVQDDTGGSIEDHMGDCMGQLISFHRDNREEHHVGLTALGNNSDGEADLEEVWRLHEAEATKRYATSVTELYSIEDIMEALEDDPDERLSAEDLLWNDCGYNGWERVHYDELMKDELEKMWSEPAFFPGDKDAQMLACYAHSGQHWSLSGGGTQCRWDTNNQAGVWVPDSYLREQLDADEAKGLDRASKAREYCEQFLSTYNSLISGDVYGCCVEVFNSDGEQVSEDSCWGFVGANAESSLKTEFFDVTCERVKSAQTDARLVAVGYNLEELANQNL